MVEQGDDLVFPTTGSSFRGEKLISKSVKNVEIKEDGGDGLFETVAFAGEEYVEFEDGSEVPFSEIGNKPMGADVTEDDVFVQPPARDTLPDPREINKRRSPEAQAADRAKDAPLTTDAEKWASSPGEYDFPGVDTGPTFREEEGEDFDTGPFLDSLF
jgi:hypothetical protein